MEKWINALKEHYGDSIVRLSNDFVILGLPFFFVGSRDSVALRINEDEKGRPIIGDCGLTVKYLEEKDVNLDDYHDKLSNIIDCFNLFRDGDSFCIKAPTNQPLYFVNYVGFFIQALSLIAYIAV